MSRSIVPLLLLLSPLAAIGCAPNSATQVLSDTSYDVAMAERFGRMDIVLDQVAPKKRDAFTKAHAAWGGDIRIVDLEYGGMRLSDPSHADVTLIIAWQRLDDASLFTTTVKQSWFHGEDHWVITKESRVSGDRGLLDEPDPKVEGKGQSEPSADPTPKSARSDGHESAKARAEPGFVSVEPETAKPSDTP
jgi:hypothetical protein